MAMIPPVNTLCPTCGEVVVRSDKIRLMICDDDLDSSFYSFTCPKCGERVNKVPVAPVRDKIVNLVPTHHWQVRPVSPDAPLTEDDVIQFGLECEASLKVSEAAE